ncbi:NUDIX domain-containing protein [Venatoribacter cucullus]|nr:NUDIX domain-containing protein [Venatoribacter cucullus]
MFSNIGRSSVKLTPLFTRQDTEVISQEVLYQGFFRMEKLQLRHRTFAGGWTPVFTRELFERGQAVCVLLYDPARDCVVLTEQFRAGALGDERSPWLLELVAGMVEPGEQYEQVARREALEEAGCAVGQLLPICGYWVSPGGTSEWVQLYCALIDSAPLGGLHGLDEEQEDIRLVTLSFTEAWQALQQGIINNAATIMALQWLKIQHHSLQTHNAPETP